MTKSSWTQSDFSKGEIDEAFDGRFDKAFYYQAAKKIENFIVAPSGGLLYPPGSYHVGKAKTSGPTRLIPWAPMQDIHIQIELSHQVMRFWYVEARTLWPDNITPLEITTPYSLAHLFELQYMQAEGVMYLVHQNYRVMKLYLSGGSFVLEEVNFLVNVWSSTRNYKKGEKVNHAAGVYEALSDNQNQTPNTTSTDWWIRVGSLYGAPASIAAWAVGTTYAAGDYVIAGGYFWKSQQGGNLGNDPTTDGGAYWLRTGSPVPSGLAPPLAVWNSGTAYALSAFCSYNGGIYRSLAAANTNHNPETDPYWTLSTSEPFLAGEGERPGSGCFHDGSLFLGGSKNRPMTIYKSAAGRFEDFTKGTADGDALEIVLAAERPAEILWMLSAGGLCVGATDGVRILSGGDLGITPTAINAPRVASFASKRGLPAELVGGLVLFFQRMGRRLRQLVYTREDPSQQSPDLTFFAPQITKAPFGGGIVETEYQESPFSVFWNVRSDGALAALSIDPTQQVAAWSLHRTDGLYKSVSATDTSASEDEELWCAVQRDIDGATEVHIERSASWDWEESPDFHGVHDGIELDGGLGSEMSGATQADPVVITALSHPFSDGQLVRISGVEGMTDLNSQTYEVANATTDTFELKDRSGTVGIDGTGFAAYTGGGLIERVWTQVTGLAHLEGKTVSVWADGAEQGEKEVVSGAIDLDWSANHLHVGLPYTATAKTLRVGKGELKRISELTLRFSRTAGFWIGPDEDSLTEAVPRATGDSLTAAPPLFSGDRRLPFAGRYDRDGYVVVQHRSPAPCHLLAIMPDVGIYKEV